MVFIVVGVIVGLIVGAALANHFAGRAVSDRIDNAVTKSRLLDQASIAALTAQVKAMESTAELQRQQLASEQQAREDLAARLTMETDLVHKLRDELEARTSELAESKASLAAGSAELRQRVANDELLQAQMEALRQEVVELRGAREVVMEANAQLSTQVATLAGQRAVELAAADEKIQLLNDARERLTGEFKLLASSIMEDNAKRFAEQSQTQIGTVIDPLRERLVELQKKVEDVYVADVKDRTALREQVTQLVALNQTLSTEAHNLTNALRGSNKAQGNWGELILQRILEDAGLRQGTEFVLQDSRASEDGRRQQPDVVVQLPEGRKIIIDAKVSLLAFERATSATSDEERGSALREHVLSVRNHVKGLSERRYEKLYDTTLDFVVMFVPIEPAFMMAVSEDERLCAEAWDKNVLLVSPSTLLFVLRTVAYLWRQEAQSKNAKDIADRGAALYEKLAGFVKDLEEVGSRIRSAHQSYDEAMKKLSTGRGSVVRQAELLKTLGVKTTKQLPKALVDEAMGAEHERDDGSDGSRAASLQPPGDAPDVALLAAPEP